MLLRAHATQAPPRASASEAPLASNARPTPEIYALQEAVEACEVVGVAVSAAVEAVAEVDADD
jgi:hypothetical protein